MADDDSDTGRSGTVLDRLSCKVRLTSPPDPLTRLLMEADGVTEAELAALLQEVATARAGT